MVESPSRSLFKKAGFVFTIALSLWAITDENISVGKALQQHEPSLRVFRSLLEVNLLLFCTAAALFVWSKTIGQSTIEALLFQPLKLSGAYPENADRHVYAMTEVNDDEVLQEDDALDADYASDGEVDRQEDLDEKLYIPNAASVADAALNMLVTILVVLFLFTLSSISTAKHSVEEVASNTNSSGLWDLFSRVTAPVFPLLLFLYFLLRAIFPWRRKRSFWAVVFMTMSAPWHPVDFRDGFIGDIITSSVRPMQDIAFTVFYILSGLRGWWSREYRDGNFIDSADASVPAMERSWLLHTVVLPMCMVSPLWWRFLQNLRQSYDSKQRWPYLGNALKYCFAAQIAMFGVFNPDQKKSVLWLTSFVGATLYQLWWDIFMDWCLLVRVDGRWKLRSTRLYTKTSVYWIICGANLVLRFCWTLSFVPPRYLNASGVLKESFSGDVKKILGPFIASAEIVRRALWGLLRFEWEATKRYSDRKSSFDESQDGLRNEIDLTPMKIKQDEYSKSSNAFSVSHSWKMSSMNEVQIIGELCVYATAFWLIGTLAAAHRGTL